MFTVLQQVINQSWNLHTVKGLSASGPAGKIFRGFESVFLYRITAGGKSSFCSQSPKVLHDAVWEFAVNSLTKRAILVSNRVQGNDPHSF